MAVNSGGSSIKYELFSIEEDKERSLARGSVKRLYRSDSFWEGEKEGTKTKKEVPHLDHEKGLRLIIDVLTQEGPLRNIQEIEAVGIKLINGGAKVTQTSFIDSGVIQALQDLSGVTSVHNPPSLLAIEMFQKILPQTPLVGVFETNFHLSIPLPYRTYGLPWELSQKYGLEKLGFHGNSHRYIAERIIALTSQSQKVISCHLGSGCSVCAIKEGKSLDVSSGFTPQSGTIMSTRPGDFDPQIITYLEEKGGFSYQEINRILTKESGLLGISGLSGEMWELEELSQKGEERAKLAIEVFIYQVKKYIGAFTALLNGLDSLVFTGGIGENDSFIREKICGNLSYLGINFDREKNQEIKGKEGKISSSTSPVEVWIIPTNEELMVARETARIVKERRK
ncbi:MAG TPA: acetate/propionate family kinase [Candidatus Atribacteria bacterium]|nr:acetate/propionate family kinase [Candidatus Atribacteria bacterium]